MDVVFLNPPFLPRFSRSQRSPAVTKSGTLYYPFWLAYAAGVLEDNGFVVKLIDAPAESINHEKTMQIIKSLNPKMVVVDTSTPSIYNDVEFTSKIKDALPGCFTLLVGSHVSALPKETLNLSGKIDAVARGEYDFTVLELARSIMAGKYQTKNIAGLTIRDAGHLSDTAPRPFFTDMDKLPMVSRVYKKHLNIRNYFFAASLYPEVQIFTSRGCPNRCFFCLWPQSFSGRNYRARSAENILEEFRFIKKELAFVQGVVIEDDTFTVDKQRVFKICELLIKNRVNLKWNANVRTDLDLETMKIMKRAGCYLIITGIETAEQSILDNINKGLFAGDIEPFFKNAKKTGLLVHAAFMAGNPGETKTSLENNLILAKKFMPDTVQFFPLMPYPGTKAYDWAKAKGFLKIDSFRDYLTKDGLHNCVIDLPGLLREDIMDFCDKSRRSFYLSQGYFFYKLRQLIVRPQEIIRTLKAFIRFKEYLLRKPTGENG